MNGANIEFALDDIYYDGSAGLNIENMELYSVQHFQLYDNYPNPFNLPLSYRINYIILLMLKLRFITL